MMTIDNDTLETVTGGSKAKGIAKIAKTALKWGGYAMDAAGTIGTVAEGAQMIKQGWDALRGNKTAPADQP